MSSNPCGHDIEQWLHKRADGRLSPEEAAALLRQVGTCSACRERAELLEWAGNALRQGRRAVPVAFSDNVIIPYEGIRADALTPGQRYLLLTLIQTYTSHMRPGHDQVWLEEIKQHLSETWFAWMGGFGDNDVFSYKVHSPVLLVEFVQKHLIEGQPLEEMIFARNPIGEDDPPG